MKLTAEMIPVIRQCKGMNQIEFADYVGIPQARLSDIETKKIPISDYYSSRLFLAIGKLKIDDKELNDIKELVKNQNI
ncbi:helix-turn-helix domain-containing protein [Niallia sp. FSL W8-1348]|uniref:helix-turn-helix domain-containing protein n=1 Tax=Niallia sp. FSL W8-1348 TaxID=2954656 RepID=UPI0030FD105D